MLQLVPTTDSTAYDHFVLTHNGSFLQSWGWGQWQVQLGRQVQRFVWQDGSTVVGAAQTILQPLPLRAGNYWYIPYGPVFAHDVDAATATQQLVTHLAQPSNTVFTRIEAKQQVLVAGSKQGTRLQPGNTLITSLAQSESTLLAGMHHKTRYNIKVAQKHGVVITHEHNAAQQAAAIKLLTSTSERQGFRSYPASYYEALLNFTQNSFTTHLYSASINNTVIAAGIMLDFGHTRTYLFGGSDYEHRALMAPYLLHFTAMLDAQAAGLTSYDWWGLSNSRGTLAGVTKFKLGFGGETITYPEAIDIPHKKLAYLAYRAIHAARRLM